MEAIHNINLTSLLDTLISLAAAFVLGGLIGFERQYRQRTAGLRTNVLVAVGAALFVDMANRLHGHEGASPSPDPGAALDAAPRERSRRSLCAPDAIR